MEENIYEIFGLSPIDDPMSSKSLKKIQSTFVNACASSDPSNFLKLLNAANILLDPEKRKLYDEGNPKIQALKRKEMLKRKIKEIALKIIEDKLPSGCFIEDIDCNLSFYSTPIVSITISKPTGKWVELCIDRAAAYGENTARKYSSPGAPYFNSIGYMRSNPYGVEDSDKNMPEYVKDFLAYPIPLAVPKGEHFLEKRELRTLWDIDRMRQLEKEGISLINGVPGRKGTLAKRMIVSSLKINYFFLTKEITDNDIVEFESLLDQIEVVSNLLSENQSLDGNKQISGSNRKK